MSNAQSKVIALAPHDHEERKSILARGAGQRALGNEVAMAERTQLQREPSILNKNSSATALESGCKACRSRELCWSESRPTMSQWLDGTVFGRKRIKRGAAVFDAGAPFEALYAVRFGSFKCCTRLPDGRTQITDIAMSGDVLGFDGIGNERHALDAIALEDSEVCVIPYAQIVAHPAQFPGATEAFARMMSAEIVREQGTMMVLGLMKAEERVAAFLLRLASRLSARGLSETDFILPMTREDIGNYLGAKLETVSRVFSRFQQRGLIDLSPNKKEVIVRDIDRLRAMLPQDANPEVRVGARNIFKDPPVGRPRENGSIAARARPTLIA